mgnify:CR=1 FL=1
MPTRSLEIGTFVTDRTTNSVRAGNRTNRTYTATNNGEFQHRQSIGTSEVTITLPSSIGDAGLCVIENHDATNFVDVGFATGNYPLRVPKGQAMKLWLTPATSALYLKADTAACDTSIAVFER